MPLLRLLGDVPDTEEKRLRNVLWGESAGDPGGWEAKLNTYNKARKKGESLVDAAERVSSAYQTKSPQYIKSRDNDFNVFERGIATAMDAKIQSFVPNPEWDYVHHENYNLPEYKGKTEKGIDAILRKKWGANVDFENKVKYGEEFYMPLKKDISKPRDFSRLNPLRIGEAEAAEAPGLRLLGDRPVPRPVAEPERPSLRLLGEERAAVGAVDATVGVEEVPLEDRRKIAILELGDIRTEPFLKLATKEEFERREADIKAKVKQVPEGVKGLGAVLKRLTTARYDPDTGGIIPPTPEEKESMMEGLQFVGNAVNELFWRPLTGWFQAMLKETARRQFKREDYVAGRAGFQSLPRAMARGLLGIEDVEGREILEAGGLPKTEELIIKHPVLAAAKEVWGAVLDVLPLPILRPVGTINRLLKEGKYAAADRLAIETSETIAKARYEQMGRPLGRTWEQLPQQTRNVAIKMTGEAPMKQLGNKSIADIFYERPYRALTEVARRQLAGRAGALRIGDLAIYKGQSGVITGFKEGKALLNIAGKEVVAALAQLTPAPAVEPVEVPIEPPVEPIPIKPPELAPPKPPVEPPAALAGEPEERNFAEISEFFERAARAEPDIAPKLSEEDIAKSQAEWKVVSYEARSGLFEAINDLGKIKPYAEGYLKEELAMIPSYLRTLAPEAKTADEMAEALAQRGFHFESDMDLINTIGNEVSFARKAKIEYKEGKQYLRDWAKRLRTRTRATERFIRSIGRLLARGTLKGPAVKRQIRIATGQVKVAEMVREDIALREVLKKEEQISRMAAVAAREVATKKFRRHAQTVKTRARERRDIREETNRLLERIRKVDTSKMSAISAEAIGDIKDILDFTKPSKKTLSSLNETRRYLEQDPEAELPDYVYEDLMRLEKFDRSEITLNELRSLADAVDHHVTLERTKQEIRVGLEMKRANEVVLDSVLEMRPVPGIKEAMITSQKGKLAKAKHIGELLKDTFGIRHDHYDLLIESLAGANSTMDKVLYQGPKEGKIKELDYRQKVFRQFQMDLAEAGFMKYNIRDVGSWLNERIRIRQFDLTRSERMSLYRHTLNDNNWLHIVEGGFAFKHGKDPYKVFKVSEEDLDAIIKSMDEAERAFAGSPVDKLFERQYHALNEVFRAKNGYDLPKEDFYYHIEVMRTALPKDLEAESVLEELKHKWVRVGLSRGRFKARRKSKLPIYLNSIAYDINSSILYSAAHIGLERPLSNASKLLYNKGFRAQLTRRYGDSTWKEIEKGLRDIAGDHLSYSSTEELLLHAKNNLTTAILGLNPFVALKQVLSFPLYSVYVKPEYLLRGFGDHISHPLELMERHKLYSPEYMERVEGGYSRDVADVFKSGAEKRLYGGQKSIREWMMGGVKLLDLNAVNPGMQGAVLQVLDELKKGKISPEVGAALNIKTQREINELLANRERYAAEGIDVDRVISSSLKEIDMPALEPTEKMALAYQFADYVTERTQPMFSPEHRSSLSRGGTIEKLATQFSSFTNQALNLIRRTWREALRTNDPEAYAKVAKVLFLLLGVNTAGVMMIDNLRSRIYRSKYRKRFGEAILDSVASYLYFIRDVERSVVSKVKRGTFRGYDINLPVLGAANTLGDTIADGIGMLTEDTKEKRRKRAGKFIDNALAISLMLNGLPYYTPKKLIEPIIKPEPKKKPKPRELKVLKTRKLKTLGGRTLRLLK